MSQLKTDLLKILELDALQISTARKKGIIIHGGQRIREAGDEVEIAIRDFLRRHLPKRYAVGCGQIIDANWHISSDFDIIIYDEYFTPSIFTFVGGRGYIPFEAVYAIGEIKSTWINSRKPMSEFVGKLDRLYELFRADVNPGDLGIDGMRANTFVEDVNKAIRNPIFKFMIVVDKGDFNDKIDDDNVNENNAPSAICLMNYATIMGYPVSAAEMKLGTRPNHCYEWSPRGASIKFDIAEFSHEREYKEGGNLAALLFLLLGFLSRCKLGNFSYNDYLGAYLRPGPT